MPFVPPIVDHSPSKKLTGKSPSVLVVEDDKAIYNACIVLLNHYEYQVSIAKTLAQGRLLLESTLPDLVILDLCLPDGDGTRLLETVRTLGLKTKVFVLTGDSTKETERKIRRWMPDRFFRKPLNFIEILQGIRDQLGLAA